MDLPLRDQIVNFTARALVVVLVNVCFPVAAADYPNTKFGVEALLHDDLKILPAPYAAALRQRVQNWENGVGVKCYHFSAPKPSEQCLPDAEMLIASIKSTIFDVDGLVFDADEWNAEAPVSDSPDILLKSPLKLHRSIPIVVSPETPQARNFNAASKSFAMNLWQEAGGPTIFRPENDKFSDLDLEYSRNFDSLPNILSIKFDVGISPRGSMRAKGLFKEFNYSLDKDRLISAKDIFIEGTHWCESLTSAAIDGLQISSGGRLPRAYNDGDHHAYLIDFEQTVCSPGRWIITSNGLKIQFEMEEIGSYSDGEPSTTVPWSGLKKFLRHDFVAHD